MMPCGGSLGLYRWLSPLVLQYATESLSEAQEKPHSLYCQVYGMAGRPGFSNAAEPLSLCLIHERANTSTPLPVSRSQVQGRPLQIKRAVRLKI